MLKQTECIDELASCLSILKDSQYCVPEYTSFLKELESHSNLRFPHLLSIFSVNLFALDGEEHRKKRRSLSPVFSMGAIENQVHVFEAIICDEISRLNTRQVDLFPFCEAAAYRCIYAFLGLDEKYHSTYLQHLDELRALTGFESGKKIKDYLSAELGLEKLFKVFSEQAQQAENEALVKLKSSFNSCDEFYSYLTIILAGSGALASTLANMLLFYVRSNSAFRLQILTIKDPKELIERMLFWCGGTKIIYRHRKNDSSRILALDIDQASRNCLPKNKILTRKNFSSRENLAFGFGAHRCIGEQLSRKVLSIAFQRFIQHFNSAVSTCDDSRQFYLGSLRSNLHCELW
ncbi:cytochrome P450 [Idiomarina sp.]|uniref:cytochrome P450 n=1 Tax=Idiomarina sp. TaxID=1874361 RepID=UPI0025C5D7D6|nr:cytochrome P450 [Idiomarina sp.]NQZ03487.1 cytochrome P450 [Idiomarina sp.]